MPGNWNSPCLMKILSPPNTQKKLLKNCIKKSPVSQDACFYEQKKPGDCMPQFPWPLLFYAIENSGEFPIAHISGKNFSNFPTLLSLSIVFIRIIDRLPHPVYDVFNFSGMLPVPAPALSDTFLPLSADNRADTFSEAPPLRF